jgi:cell division protein FtsX
MTSSALLAALLSGLAWSGLDIARKSLTRHAAPVVIAAALMLADTPEAGPIPAVLLGISLVIGAFGYALRVRGFSETVSGRESQPLD